MLQIGLGATFLTTDEIVPLRLIAASVAQVGEFAHDCWKLFGEPNCSSKDFSVEGVSDAQEVGIDIED